MDKFGCNFTSPPALKYADIIDLVEDRNDLLDSPKSCFDSARFLMEVSKSSIVGGVPSRENASLNASVRPSFVTKGGPCDDSKCEVMDSGKTGGVFVPSVPICCSSVSLGTKLLLSLVLESSTSSLTPPRLMRSMLSSIVVDNFACKIVHKNMVEKNNLK
ncbi:MAG: hypothetical protein P8N21_01875, partial [Opitutales bacterium]|nr:hypothetical protein [Opitutales bacterium]